MISKSFEKNKNEKVFPDTLPDLLHLLQSVTFSGAAPIICSSQSDSALISPFCKK
jgi:hypothetical protein